MLETPVALRHGRDLVSPELFEKVSEFCAQEYGHELSTARRTVDQALAFLKVTGNTRAFDMTPSDAVGLGWRSFVLHTQAYAAWCHEQEWILTQATRSFVCGSDRIAQFQDQGWQLEPGGKRVCFESTCANRDHLWTGDLTVYGLSPDQVAERSSHYGA
ncbi:hypothetical protein ABR738_09165 [Streptomyces sp. Edi4]|uniref:hypothetical protein n=1 Tax=Streptomyces sp. Edi4 TaxID=3162527 RepID=UPI0033067007